MLAYVRGYRVLLLVFMCMVEEEEEEGKIGCNLRVRYILSLDSAVVIR